MLHNFSKILIFFVVSYLSLHAEQFTDSFRLDGYGNVNMFKSNRNDIDNFKLSGGFQGRYQLNDTLSITGQIFLEEGQNSNGRASNSLSDYDVDLQWLYIDYYLKNDFTLRLGEFQFPIFKSSETGNIGYTYTWTQTPLSFYGVFGCDDYRGAEILKTFSYKEFDFLAQVSYGKSENELDDGRGNSREGEVEDLMGLTLKTTHDDFILNIGYLKAQSNMNISNDRLRPREDIDFDMFALESEIYIDDFTLKSGFIKTNLSNVFPEDLKYYTSLEYSFDDFTPYILYAKENLEFKDTDNGNDRRTQTEQISRDKYSIGLRYDYSAHVAFKTSYTHTVSTTTFDGFEDEKSSNDIFMGTINVIF